MTTDVHTAEKFLAYDGDCPMCIATVGAIVRWGLVRQEQTRPNYDLDAEDAELARAAGIRNQLVVIDPITRQTRVGSDALLWIIGETTRYRPLARVLSLPGLRQLLSVGYQAISYNRRIVSPPKHQIVCDCEPQVTVARRLTLIVPLLLMSMVIVAGFGAAALVGCELGTAADGALVMFAATSAGWTLMGLGGAVRLGGMRAIDYLGHLAVTMFAGALILLPGALITAWLPRPAAAAVALLSLMYCFSTMFKMQLRRVKAQQLPLTWTWAWTAAMLGTFGLTLAVWFRDFL